LLEFAITYRRVALDKVTVVVADDHDMNLRKFELSEEEWIIATNLRDALLLIKVRVSRDPGLNTHWHIWLATASNNCQCGSHNL
jgi:hypothetical protein